MQDSERPAEIAEAYRDTWPPQIKSKFSKPSPMSFLSMSALFIHISLSCIRLISPFFVNRGRACRLGSIADNQASQNDPRFEISCDCVVIGGWFWSVKLAANGNTVGGNLKTGVIMRCLQITLSTRLTKKYTYIIYSYSIAAQLFRKLQFL